MKRTGNIYNRMADWNLLIEAEKIAVRGKKKNLGARKHERYWLKNRIEIHNSVLSHSMRTSDYKHEQKISGQGKLRDIAKLDFHPSHIQHQLLVMAAEKEIDRSLIFHTYASRKGFGQHAAAKKMNEWIQSNHHEFPIYVQFDICKYYDSIPHSLLRIELERILKDKEFIDAFLEPIEKFAPSGKGIPLGIRPSQTFGNLALSSLDRYIKEQLKVKFYLRYLDDFVILCRNKGEAHRFIALITEKVNAIGFKLHEPKLRHLTDGLDFMGYVTYPGKGMFWRKSDKVAWLRRRKKVTNPRRLREIDASAWGFISHGNKHCKKLYKKMGGIPFEKFGIKSVNTDKNGNRIIGAPQINIAALVNREIIVKDVVRHVITKHGEDRVALLVDLMGNDYKVITNSFRIKRILDAMEQLDVTKFSTVIIDAGNRFYEFETLKTSILEINNRPIELSPSGETIFADTKEVINLNISQQ